MADRFDEIHLAGRNWLKNKFPAGFKCECCGGEKWYPNHYLSSVGVDENASSRKMYFISFTCHGCFNNKFFDAAPMIEGLL